MRHSPPSAAQSGRVSRSPRDAGRRPPPGELAGAPGRPSRLICWGYVPRREPSRRLGYAPPRPCGPLCRPEVGVPLPAGPSLPVGSAPRWEPSRRLGFWPPRPCGPLCRPEVGVPLPAGPSLPVGSAPRREPSRRLGVRPPPALRAAVPVGDRRSSRPRACSRSAVRGTRAGRMERHRRGFRAPARCRSETGAPGRARACSRSVVRGTHAGGMGASSARVSRFRAMPVGDRRSWPCPRLFSVCGARHSRWRDGALSVLVSRSRAMPV